MKVFITGGTGYIGAVVTERLLAAGHAVAGLARSEESARKLAGTGAEAVRGDLRDAAKITEATRSSDAAIHAAMERSADAPDLDRTAVDAVLAAFRHSGRPFIYTSGNFVIGNTGGRAADESTPLNPVALVAWRPGHEQMVLRAEGMRGIVIRPSHVWGRGGGMVAEFARAAKKDGVVRYVGSGENRWPFVHVEDLADLYLLALDARGGSLYLASAGPSLEVREAARIAARGARIESTPLEEARRTMGGLADGLVLDQLVTSRKAMEELRWKPRHCDPRLAVEGSPGSRGDAENDR